MDDATYKSCLSNTGDESLIIERANQGGVINSGDKSYAINCGKNSIAGTTGNNSKARVMKKNSIAVSSGKGSGALCGAKGGLAVAVGENSKAKGTLGSWLVLTEMNLRQDIVCDVKCVLVDGKNIKPNRWYSLRNGEIVENADDPVWFSDIEEQSFYDDGDWEDDDDDTSFNIIDKIMTSAKDRANRRKGMNQIGKDRLANGSSLVWHIDTDQE